MKKLLMLTFLILSSSVFAEIVDPDPTGDYEGYCMLFGQENPLGMKKLLRGMTASSYSVDSYFEHSLCQPDGYSDAVKCPMIHKVADDPEKNERKLFDLWSYYSIQRQAPGLFTKAINTQNTDGQTLLDYIEHMSLRDGGYSQVQINSWVKNIIGMLCDHGGVYKFYKNKSCPK
jgi:hypothetical protein